MKGFVESFKQGSGYTWISNNYMELTKSELANIIKELIYGIETHISKNEAVTLYEDIVSEMETWYET